MTPLRFGLVGAGGIAQTYVQVFASLEGVRVVGVADPRPGAATATATALGCAHFASHERLADAGGLDAVLVCTPPATHVPIALHFIDRGVAVLCEKPLAIAVDDARRLVSEAASEGVPVAMAAKFRYVEDVIRARALVAEGVIGEPILFENVFASRVDMAGRWNADPAVAGGGVLIDNGTHSVDIVRYLVGPIAEVMALEGKRVQQLAVEDTVQVFVRTDAGVAGNIDLSWSLDKGSESYVHLYGSEGTISIGWRQSRYRRADEGEWVAFGDGYDKLGAMRSQVANFCAAVQGEDELLITPEDAIASVEVIEAAYQSLGRDLWVPAQTGRRSGTRVA